MESQNIEKLDIATVREYDDKIVVTVDTKNYKTINSELLQDNTLFLYADDFEMQLTLSEEFTNPSIESNNGFVTITQEK